MPVAKVEPMGKESCWGLWHIVEDERDLSFLAMESSPEDLISLQKRLEFLAGRALVKALVEQMGRPYTGIRKDDHGKPYLRENHHHISLSHSYPYVAAQVHPSRSVGIDVEQPKDKLLRIASRVLSKSEEEDAGNDIVKHCVYWCAKETMYKIHGKRGLHFNSQLNLEPFRLDAGGTLTGSIKSNEGTTSVSMGYNVQPEFVLVFTHP